MQMHFAISKDSSEKKNELDFIIKSAKLKSYQGWWIYGEGQHLYKDEKTLDEYKLEFPNENMQELRELYLAVCEMEYLPMECIMNGYLKKNLFKKEKILVVSKFEILYIEGCEE